MAKAGLVSRLNPSVKTDGNTNQFNFKVNRLYNGFVMVAIFMLYVAFTAI